jgi:hypothetical protein
MQGNILNFHRASAAPVNNRETQITIPHSLSLFTRIGKGYMFSKGIGNIVTYVAFFFHPVSSTIFTIALVMLEVATPR